VKSKAATLFFMLHSVSLSSRSFSAVLARNDEKRARIFTLHGVLVSRGEEEEITVSDAMRAKKLKNVRISLSRLHTF
jgi:uncharacterized protein YvpB